MPGVSGFDVAENSNAQRRELPDEAFIPTRIVVGKESFERVVSWLESKPEPSEALRELMRG